MPEGLQTDHGRCCPGQFRRWFVRRDSLVRTASGGCLLHFLRLCARLLSACRLGVLGSSDGTIVNASGIGRFLRKSWKGFHSQSARGCQSDRRHSWCDRRALGMPSAHVPAAACSISLLLFRMNFPLYLLIPPFAIVRTSSYVLE